MLVKITNQCGAGCSHCMEESVPTAKGSPAPHMTAETFTRSLAFTKVMEHGAYQLGAPPLLLLSGGECTEHPRIAPFVAEALNEGFVVVLLTNGLWLADPAARRSLLRPEWSWPRVQFQVTHDPRFYPKPITRISDPRITYIPALTHLLPLGRAKRKANLSEDTGVPVKGAPTSFNLRSMTRSLGSFAAAVCMLRLRAAQGFSGHCSPSISHEGHVMAGETRSCWQIGNVENLDAQITAQVHAMGACNRCGLEENLPTAHRAAIGLGPSATPAEALALNAVRT